MSAANPTTSTGFAGALRRHGQVILTLLVREEETRRKHPVDALLHMLEPVVLVGTMLLLWWLLGRTARAAPPVGDSVVLFYATGFYPYLFIVISRRMARFVEKPRGRFPVEQRLDYVLVHIILRFIDYSVFGVLAFAGIYFFVTEAAFPHDWGVLLQGVVSIILLGFGWGVVVMVFSPMHWLVRLILPRFSRVFIFFSGVFHVPDFLPPNIREILSWNPLLHAVNLFRQGFYYNYPSLLLDTHYLVICIILFVLLGLALERATRRAEGA